MISLFSASYDKASKIISAIVSVGLLVAALAAHSVGVALLSIAILGLALGYSPRGYVITPDWITVKRFLWDGRIRLEGMREARLITKDDLRGCIRLWGNGGLFGYYGLFRTRKLGVCSWYVTNRRNAVLVKTAGKTVLFSPDDKDAFLFALHQAAPVQTPIG